METTTPPQTDTIFAGSATPSKIDGKPADLPLVSVVIPAYNSRNIVGRAIESALIQTHHPLEIIVVDDGSTDGTADVARKYQITVISQSNSGPAGARNTGVNASSGDWIAFLDHDDTWHSEKTSEQLSYVTPEISAVFCEKSRPASDITFDDLYWRNYAGNPSSTMIRRSVLLDLGLFDADPALFGLDDYNMWLRFLWRGYRFATTPVLYNFTPADDHYGGKLDKMLAAELVNIEKISKMAGIPLNVSSIRKRNLYLNYISAMTYSRYYRAAFENLCAIGIREDSLRLWLALLPRWLFDRIRRVGK